MAVADDLNRLATQDVVYLSRSIFGVDGTSTARQVFRGRLRQALSGSWVFNAFTGQNGVVGFDLGVMMPNWNSVETPYAGIGVTITNTLSSTPSIFESITLTTVIPTDFTE